MDLQKFLNAALQPRHSVIAVPELAAWFAPDVPPTWEVRGLSAAELARANQAAESGLDNVRAMVAALAGEGDKAAAIRTAMGLSQDDVPADVIRRIDMLAAGSVLPVLGADNRDVAVKLAEEFPTVFYQLTNSIISLTGQGAVPGKPSGSGATPP
jgi:hypothetical protein